MISKQKIPFVIFVMIGMIWRFNFGNCTKECMCPVYAWLFSLTVIWPTVCNRRGLRWLSWLWLTAATQHLSAWPQDLRLRRRQGADDCSRFCQGINRILNQIGSFGGWTFYISWTWCYACQGLLALEGELTPILVQMVKSANMNGLLDNDTDSLSGCQQRVKARLHDIMQKDQDFTDEEFDKVYWIVLPCVTLDFLWCESDRRNRSTRSQYVQKYDFILFFS